MNAGSGIEIILLYSNIVILASFIMNAGSDIEIVLLCRQELGKRGTVAKIFG